VANLNLLVQDAGKAAQAGLDTKRLHANAAVFLCVFDSSSILRNKMLLRKRRRLMQRVA